jgi:hypothetical protein
MNLIVDAVTDDAEKTVRAFITKEWWLAVAEIIDALRLVPRSILFAQASFTIWACKALILWYCCLPNAHRTGADAAAVTSIITVLTSILVVTLNFYMKQGRVWAGQPTEVKDIHTGP